MSLFSMLTKRQKEILNFIEEFLKENEYSPSLQEIGEHFGLSSVATIHQHVEALRRKGYLAKEANQSRSLHLADEGPKPAVAIPLIGTITAGQPVETYETPEEIQVPAGMVSDPARHFALRVSGSSMIDEGILDGDVVIVRKQSMAENGDTVVALINGRETTLKKIYREKRYFRLQPANPSLRPIFVKHVTIQGKVAGVIRSFHINPFTPSPRNRTSRIKLFRG
ncbi:transcriptional repressor LexA [Candidatus Azambacteria bacterium]|nr:transcriptional repressor LexA [Candidatus Azambacteria bacterium]